MKGLIGVHHVAIIASDYQRSRAFYTEVIGGEIVSEILREERQSHKLNLRLPGGVEIELFSFPNPPPRTSRPEACGLRHLALRVTDIESAIDDITAKGIEVEEIRVDSLTNRRFTFFADPDGLPIELYEESVL